MRALGRIKRCKKRLPLKIYFLRKRQFLAQILKDFRPEVFCKSESTQICTTRVCFLLSNSTTNLFTILTDLLLYAYVGIHQVRVLVFDNFQKVPSALNQARWNMVRGQTCREAPPGFKKGTGGR